jgi:hypothetical protein
MNIFCQNTKSTFSAKKQPKKEIIEIILPSYCDNLPGKHNNLPGYTG